MTRFILDLSPKAVQEMIIQCFFPNLDVQPDQIDFCLRDKNGQTTINSLSEETIFHMEVKK